MSDVAVRGAALAWLLRIDGSRGAIAGLAGGAAMAAYEMVAMWATGHGALAPLELIGAAQPVSSGTAGVLVGLGSHLITSAYWGTQLGAIAEPAPIAALTGRRPLWLGVLWGAAVWAIMGKIVGPILDPAIAQVPEPHFFIGHVIYGAISALVVTRLLLDFPSERAPR